jgi:acetylornithine/succinyldiaminopimelate/putrescine aminotransferase
VNSGTEANEAALKLAKKITKRSRIISCYGAYHGSTHGSLSLSSNEVKKEPFRPLLPEVDFIRFNEPEDLALIKSDVACVFMETIQGDAGVRIPDINYMRALRKICDETGALLVLDEIQCGLGRSGSWFAFEQFAITPDILTLGKALGSGMPIGALISSREHMSAFSFDPMLGHITTFGGHPVVCAAANAGLEVLEEEALIEQVNEKGQLFYDLLKDHPAIKHIRYKGLFFAIDMESPEVVQKVVEQCLASGLIAFWFLSCPWAFRIAPPFVISEEEIRQSCSIILNAMDSVL